LAPSLSTLGDTIGTRFIDVRRYNWHQVFLISVKIEFSRAYPQKSPTIHKMSSMDCILTEFEKKDVIVTIMILTLAMVFSTFALTLATLIMVTTFPKVSDQVTPAEAEVETEVQAEEEADEEVQGEEEAEAQLYRLALPSGKEMGLKKNRNHMGIGLVEPGNGQVFKVIPLLTGTFAGTIQLHPVGDYVKGKALDNYHQDNDRLCLHKYTRDNNRAQNWKKDGNKLISMVTGKRAIKENGDSIGFSEIGDDITFIPV